MTGPFRRMVVLVPGTGLANNLTGLTYASHPSIGAHAESRPKLLGDEDRRWPKAAKQGPSAKTHVGSSVYLAGVIRTPLLNTLLKLLIVVVIIRRPAVLLTAPHASRRLYLTQSSHFGIRQLLGVRSVSAR